MRRSNYAFRRFGRRRYGKFSRRRYWNSRRRRGYPIYNTLRNKTNRAVSRMGNAYDLLAYGLSIDVRTIWAYQAIDWTLLNLSADFNQFSDLFSTFIPKYFKVRWVPAIQHNASGYYVPGQTGEPITTNLFDGFSTTRYDEVDNPIAPNAAMQYNTFKTWNPARSWTTIVYPRRNQMIAPRQRFIDYAPLGPNAVVNDNIRGMGRLWPQFKVTWEDADYNVNPQIPTPDQRIIRLSQTGHFYITYYFYSFDRR